MADDRLRTLIEVIGRFTLPAIDQVHGAAPLSHGRCIISALVVRDVLRALDYADAREIPCTVLVGNRLLAGQFDFYLSGKGRGLSNFRHGQALAAYRDSGAYAIHLGGSDTDEDAGRWRGHLVTVVGETLVDLTLGQATRPDQGIDIGATAVPCATSMLRRDNIIFARHLDTFSGSVAYWYTAPQNRGYRDSLDYQDAGRRQPVVERVLDYVYQYMPVFRQNKTSNTP